MNIEKIIADFFGLPVEKISDVSSPRTIGDWDSLKHIELVMLIEKECGIRFKASEIPMLTSVGNIKKRLEAR